MKGCGRDAGRDQLARDFVGAVLGPGEDENRVHRLIAEKVDEQLRLGMLLCLVDELRHRLGRVGAAANLNDLRFREHLACNGLDLFRQRG